jgi:hypothetical protein
VIRPGTRRTSDRVPRAPWKAVFAGDGPTLRTAVLAAATVAVLALVVSPADASDAGLRRMAQDQQVDQRGYERELRKAADGVGKSRSLKEAKADVERWLTTSIATAGRFGTNVDGYHRRVTAEPAGSADGTEGRALLLQGLRHESRYLATLRSGFRKGVRAIRRVKTVKELSAFQRELGAGYSGTDGTSAKSELGRARELLRSTG